MVVVRVVVVVDTLKTGRRRRVIVVADEDVSGRKLRPDEDGDKISPGFFIRGREVELVNRIFK